MLWVGPVQNSSVDGPQAAKDPEEGALAAAIGAGDQHVHALVHLKRAEATALVALVTPGQQPQQTPCSLLPPTGYFK